MCDGDILLYSVTCVCLCVFCFSEPDSRLTVLSVKAMLAMLCGGKLIDKLRCEYQLKPSGLVLH